MHSMRTQISFPIRPSLSDSPQPEQTYDPMTIIPAHPLLALLAILGAVASFFTAKLAQAVPTLDQTDILGSTFLTMMCLAGSLGGSAIYVLTFASNESPRDVWRKGISCASFAGLFTPILIRWQDWPQVPSVCLAASGVMALFALALLHAGVPWGNKKIDNSFPKDGS